MLPIDDQTVVDLQEDEVQEAEQHSDQANEPLISSSSSLRIRKLIVGAVFVFICICGMISVSVWRYNNDSVLPTPTTTIRPGPVIPTIRPLPKNASDLDAEKLLYLVFGQDQLDFIQIRRFPQSPPTFKYMLQVKNFANFTGESSTRLHAMDSVSRNAAASMFGLDYSAQPPIPPPPQACQAM